MVMSYLTLRSLSWFTLLLAQVLYFKTQVKSNGPSYLCFSMKIKVTEFLGKSSGCLSNTSRILTN
jgi:hypothetical protein